MFMSDGAKIVIDGIMAYKVGSDTAVATAKTLTVSANDVDNTQA